MTNTTPALHTWEKVRDTELGHIHRLRVPGGWLYESRAWEACRLTRDLDGMTERDQRVARKIIQVLRNEAPAPVPPT